MSAPKLVAPAPVEPVAPVPVEAGGEGRGRRTIGRPAEVSGLGLHYGRPCRLRFEPAPPGHGIVFRRADRPDDPPVPATVDMARQVDRRTQLGEGEGALHTVEHVLAAVGALRLDDLAIVLDGPEPPIADGSSAPFLAALAEAGVVAHGGTPEWLVLRRPLRVVEGDAVYEATPCLCSSLAVSIDFPHPLIGRQAGEWSLAPETFATELAAARTFGFVHEVEQLRGLGLIRGASLENAVVLDADGLVSGPLRWADEFVRHKALDCIGDLALAGARVRARVVAHRPSHRGTIAFVRELVRTAVRETAVYSIDDILQVLPHRYPFLLVDRIEELDEGQRIVGLKNVTINEPFFQGHFPGHPIMPGVLIIEAMAQVGGMLLMRTIEDPATKVVYFMSLDKVKFRKPVKPGDQLRLELDVVALRGPTCKMRGVATVDGEVVCQAEMAAMVRDR